MSIGKRIKFFRNLRGMSQKELGILAGFQPHTADIRIAQYESSTRTPRCDILNRLANCLNVSTTALEAPSFETESHFIQTLFMIEDQYGLEIKQTTPFEINLKLNLSSPLQEYEQKIIEWANKYDKFKHGEITKEEYDQWRYNDE